MIEQEDKKEQESVVYPVIEFDVEDLQVVSVNDMYSVNRGRGRAIRRSSKYEQFSTNMKWQLRQKVPRKQIHNFIKTLYGDKNLAVSLSIEVSIPKRSFFRSDCSNLIKSFEDVIKEDFELDDSRNCPVTISKRLSPDTKWNTHVRLEIHKLPYEVKEDKWPRVLPEDRLKGF